MYYFIIGCGGIGSRLAPELLRMIEKDDILALVDKDVVEERNLDRQFFPVDAIGQTKSQCIKNMLPDSPFPKVIVLEEYLGENSTFTFPEGSTVIVCADNHPARLTALDMCDDSGSRCIICANEYTDGEAYFYLPLWKDNETRDPRHYYPELLSSTAGDPLAPPCTGEEAEATPQLGLANLKAATYGLQLLWAWREVAPQLEDPEVQAVLPFRIKSTATRTNAEPIGEGGITCYSSE